MKRITFIIMAFMIAIMPLSAQNYRTADTTTQERDTWTTDTSRKTRGLPTSVSESDQPSLT